MKKSDLNEMFGSKRTLYSQLITSLKRALRLIGNESESSNSQTSTRGLPNTFLTYNEPQEINAQLVRMEIHKAEAIQIMREQNRRV